MIYVLDIGQNSSNLYNITIGRKNVSVATKNTFSNGLTDIDGLMQELLINPDATDHKYYFMLNDASMIYRCIELSPLSISFDLNKTKVLSDENLDDLVMLALDNLPASCNKSDYTANILTLKYNITNNLYYLSIAYAKTETLDQLRDGALAAGLDIFGIYTLDFGIYNVLDIDTETIIHLDQSGISILANDYGYLVLRSEPYVDVDRLAKQAILKANAERSFGGNLEYTNTLTVCGKELVKTTKYNTSITLNPTNTEDPANLIAATGIVIYAESRKNKLLLKTHLTTAGTEGGKRKNAMQSIRQLFSS